MLRYYAEGAFSNKHLNWLNLHLGIVNFGQVLRLQINGVFLYALGLTLPEVCLAMGALIGLRWVFRTPLIYIPHLFGSKAALILGQLLLALAFLLYGMEQHPGPLLWGALTLMAAGEALYWHAVHTTFATLSEFGKFGRQLSARNIFMSVGALCAPVVTGLVHHEADWGALYLLSAGALLLGLLPLLFMPEPCPPKPLNWSKGLMVNKAGMKLFAGWGAASAVMAVVWPLVLYQQFGTIEKFAGVMTLTTLIAVLISVFVARRIDLGKGRNVVIFGAIAYVGMVLSLACFGTSPLKIALLSSGLSLCASTYTQPFNASLYRWAKETHDPLWFHYWSEFGWDLGNLTVLWTIAGMLAFMPDIGLRWTMIIIIPTLVWCYAVYVTDGRVGARARPVESSLGKEPA